ncbi:MAG TPA: hypothetical protein VFY39_17875 [Gammaproteobacteria bacterium]|nr:hypothetical protein [Gammaproteobacteria bacterium]
MPNQTESSRTAALIERGLQAAAPVASRALVLDGIEFQWWAVGERPAVVTVRHRALGGRTELTGGDPEKFARWLAKVMLDTHHAKRPLSSGAPYALDESPSANPCNQANGGQSAVDAFSKPGWFSRP